MRMTIDELRSIIATTVDEKTVARAMVGIARARTLGVDSVEISPVRCTRVETRLLVSRLGLAHIILGADDEATYQVTRAYYVRGRTGGVGLCTETEYRRSVYRGGECYRGYTVEITVGYLGGLWSAGNKVQLVRREVDTGAARNGSLWFSLWILVEGKLLPLFGDMAESSFKRRIGGTGKEIKNRVDSGVLRGVIRGCAVAFSEFAVGTAAVAKAETKAENVDQRGRPARSLVDLLAVRHGRELTTKMIREFRASGNSLMLSRLQVLHNLLLSESAIKDFVRENGTMSADMTVWAWDVRQAINGLSHIRPIYNALI